MAYIQELPSHLCDKFEYALAVAFGPGICVQALLFKVEPGNGAWPVGFCLQ